MKILFLILLYQLLIPINCEWISLIARRPTSLVTFQINSENGNVTEPKTVLTGIIDKFSTYFVVDVNQSTVVLVDPSHQQHDRIQIAKISSNSEVSLNTARTLNRQSGVADELISSQSIDWITQKVYIAVDQVGTKKSGRIEACPIIESKDGCTILLTNNFGMHSLVVDPTEGNMYWLNKVENRIESAWMNGQFLDKNPFHDTFSNDPKVTVAALTLDPVEKMLYYLRVWQEKCEIVACKIHHRDSCKVVATPDEASHLAIYKDKIFWSNFNGQIYFCQKENCRKTTKRASNIAGFERFAFLSQEVQPKRKDPNLCESKNGGCSDFCLLHPGEPFKSCACPIGVRLLSDNSTCDPAGIRRALFVAAKSTLFYISLDTREFAPKRIAYEENPATPVSIIDVDYDPLREAVYWLDAAKGEVRRSFLNGSDFEIVVSKLSPTVQYIAFDWLGRNIYLLDSETGRLEIQKVEGGFYRKTIIPGGHEKPCCIQADPQSGFIYFGNFYGEHARIERAFMDGSHRQVLISLPKVRTLTDLIIDAESDTVYWVEGETSKIGSAKLSNGNDIKIISNDFQHLQAIAKLGDVLYSSSSVARSVTAISLGKNDFPLQKDFFDGQTSDGSKYEQFDSVIFHQTALKASILKPKHQSVFSRHSSAAPAAETYHILSKPKHSRLNINGCFPGNGGCSEICVNLPASQYQCLCSAGAELQNDFTSCKIPSAFFVLTQSNVTDDLMRLSLIPETPNYEALAVPNISSIPSTIALDSSRKFIYYAVENRQTQMGSILRTPFMGASSDLIIESSTLRQINGIAVDSISETIFISNGFLKRIEAISMDGKKRRTLVWDNLNPKFLVFHPYLRKLFFVNSNGNSSEIVWISSIQSSKVNVMAENVGKVTALEIDVKTNKLFWSSISDSQGAVLSARIDSGYTEQLLGSSTIFPKALSFFNDNLYMANDVTGSIDVLAKDGTSKQLHANVPHIRSLIVAHKTSETTSNPCITRSVPDEALCLFSNTFGSSTKSFNVSWACEDQFDYDISSKKCIPPTKFILFASKDRFIRYRIRQHGIFSDDPYSVLSISNIGQPISLVFDSLSPNRYLYWIDAHDRDGGRIKRASDFLLEKTQHISLMKESNCSQIFDIEIDEIGRHLFVSCAPSNDGDIAFIHVWRIDEDDELDYIGKVVAGDRKSVATNSFPNPRKIVVFGRLNALFYADCSRMLESPAIVRCQLDGRQCTTVVSRGIDCATLQLEADLASPRLIYTTFDGIWSRDVYVDGDLRRLIHYPQGPQHLSLAPLNDQSLLIVASNETKTEEKLFQFKYESSMQELSQLEAISKWIQPPSETLVKRISSLKVVGNGRIEASKLEYSCVNSECSHLCRIPYDTGSLGKRRYECLCPLDYSPSNELSTMCVKNLECQNWQFRCFNGKQCIHISRRCDGVPDCFDRSDESGAVCPLQTPSNNNHDSYQSALVPQISSSSIMWNCDGGKTTAIGLHLFCNGMADCSEDSDEKHCRCSSPADEFDCTAWQKWARRTFEERSNEPDCIPRSLMCDGISHCRNGADELPMLCSLIHPVSEAPDSFSISNLFDVSRRQPAYIIIIIALLFALIFGGIGCCIYYFCCCRQKRRNAKKNKPFFDHHNASTTLLSNQRTMMTGAPSQTSQHLHQHHFTRLTIPSNQPHQVEVALRTYPCSNNGSDYGYIPSQLHPAPSSTATYQRHQYGFQQQPHQPPSSYGYHTLPYNFQSSYNPHLQFVQSSTDALPAPNGGADLNIAFYAPPPSAASLSTYGVVKPAFMPQNITPNRTRERSTLGRKNQSSTMGRKMREEENLKNELFQFCVPPSYSEIGSALECSTPRSDRPPPRTKSGRHQRDRQKKLAREQMKRQEEEEEAAAAAETASSSSTVSESSDTMPHPPQALQRIGGSSSSGPSAGAIPPKNSSQSNSSGSNVNK